MSRTDDVDHGGDPARRFRSLVEATATEVFSNAPDGRLLSDIPRWRRLTGQTREATLGFGWLDAVHPDDAAEVERAWRHAVATGTVFDAEYRVRRAEGGWAHVWVRSAPLLGDDGEIAEYVGLYHDVTERVERLRATEQLEAALDRERLILERAVQQNPVGVAIVWGPEHRFRIVNDAFRRAVPGGRDFVGRTVAEVLPEAGHLLEQLTRARAGETVELPDVAIEFGGPSDTEGHRYYRAVYTPLIDADGTPGGVLATVIETTADVRRRRGLERELEREREVAAMLQRTMLPDSLPDIEGVEFCARYEPAGDGRFVGGDWYDVFDAGDGRVAVAVGDVEGRGLQAATIMGQLRAALRAYAFDDPSPGSVLARMDELVDRLGRVATLAYALLDPADGHMLQGLAGHPPPLMVSGRERPSWLREGLGAPLGTASPGRRAAEIRVPGGATVLYYTDGMLQEREIGIEAGMGALRDQLALAGTDRADLGDVCSSLLDGHAQRDDDRALLVLRRRA